MTPGGRDQPGQPPLGRGPSGPAQPDLDQLAADLARGLTQGPAAALAAAAELLTGLRPMDPAAAAQVLGRELAREGWAVPPPGPGDAPLAAARELAARLAALAARPACLGCGACCRASSPTLYLEDLDLLGPAGPGRSHFVTLRAGEWASSARLGRSAPLTEELVKVREQPHGGGCVFRAAAGCAIYAQRPLQCRHLECWSGRHAGQLAHLPRLDRSAALAADPTARALAAEWEMKFPAGELAQALEAVRCGEKGAQAAALAILEADHHLRQAVSSRYGYPAAELDLILGRAALDVARSHGLGLALDQAGAPRLTPLRPGSN
ncbi:MAG: YkgJ family cysteine cluster protein [Deltaproteobacteria bacterium]|nr:YkgJ family cysteine cluster protein [Deltaproteobacteria bacterium]